MTRRNMALGAFGLGALLAAAAGLPASHAFAEPTVAFRHTTGEPRIAALGGHVICLLTDQSATDQNPARLVYGTRTVGARYDRLDPDVEMWSGRIGAAFPLGPDAAEPLQLSRPRRSAVGASLDLTGLSLIEGSSYNEVSATAGYGYTVANFVATGVALRYNYATSANGAIRANGFGVDIGFSLDLSDHYDAAIAIQNAFGRVTFDGGDDEDLPARLTIGVATARRHRFQAEVDYVFQENRTAALALGVEVHVLPGTLDLRAGVSRESLGSLDRTVPSAGMGFFYRQLRLDYAFAADQDGAMDTQHRIGVGASF